MRVPLPLVGSTGGHRSTQFDPGVTQNMYMEMTDGRAGAFDFPGLKPVGSLGGLDRGGHVMDGALYRLVSGSLYHVSNQGVYTELGDVSGDDRAVFADDGTNLYLTANGRLWKYDGSAVAEVVQTVVIGPSAIAYINRQFILSGINGVFGTSDVADGDTYNTLNFAEAESKPDILVRPYVFNQLVYMMGGSSTELWYNSGVGSPPFDRQDTALVNVGLAGKHAVTNTDAYLYFVGDDRKIYQCVGAQSRNKTTPAISHRLEKMIRVSDCVASSFVLEGQDFVLFSFTNETLLYSETFDYWVELDSFGKWYGSQVLRAYGDNLVLDYRSGDVHKLDLDTYTDDGDTRVRVRTLAPMNGALIGEPGKRILVKGLRINMQVGVGLESGQGANPVLMCQFSPDGGHTWQAERQVSMGELGNYTQAVDFWDFCSGYDVRARIKCSDPVFLALFDGEVELEAVGF